MDNREDNNIDDTGAEEMPGVGEAYKLTEAGKAGVRELLEMAADEGGEAPEAAADVKPKKKRLAEELFEWVEVFSSALLTVILVFTFVFRMVTVEGPSMQYTLHARDHLVISHLFYTPRQNDIVVIQVPNAAFSVPIIKRVIATEGQTIDFDFENWRVYVDGELIDEPYVNYMAGRPMESYSIMLDALPITVEPGKIFVMGDNRNLSADSRNAMIGQVDINNVVGRVMIRVFPFDQFGVVRAAEN